MNNLTIYYNEKRICFISKNSSLTEIKTHYSLFIEPKTEEEIKSAFLLLKDNELIQQLNIVSSNLKKTLGLFASIFKNIEAAGGLIKNNKNEYLFINRLGKWDLPKGKLEKGEAIKKAAIRECEEECGVNNLKIEKTLNPTYHIYFHKEKYVLKRTHWFLISTDFKGKLIPQTEEGITEVKWIKKAFLKQIKTNTYISLLEIINTI